MLTNFEIYFSNKFNLCSVTLCLKIIFLFEQHQTRFKFFHRRIAFQIQEFNNGTIFGLYEKTDDDQHKKVSITTTI